MSLEMMPGMSTIATPTYLDDVHRPNAALRPTRPVARPWRRALFAFSGAAPVELGSVRSIEAACIVADDPGEVVRGAKPISAADRDRMREQHISRLLADYRRQN